MSSRERTGFISAEPKLAHLLRAREPKILSTETYCFIVDYVGDVGAVMRSREYKVSMLATGATYALLIGATKLFPVLSKFGVLSEAFGVKR